MQDEGLSPDAIAFLWILKACGSIGVTEKGEEIKRQGYWKKIVHLAMHSKCGELANEQNVVLWNSPLDGYVHDGQCDGAICCFGQMQGEGLSPDAVTFVRILKACGIIGAVRKGEEIHKEVDRQELMGKNDVLRNALVDMYAKCRQCLTSFQHGV